MFMFGAGHEAARLHALPHRTGTSAIRRTRRPIRTSARFTKAGAPTAGGSGRRMKQGPGVRRAQPWKTAGRTPEGLLRPLTWSLWRTAPLS